ncbi:MAG: zinc transporter ZntB [Bdellovibrionota bacterium]
MNKHILFAYLLDSKGGCKVLTDNQEISSQIKAEQLAWVHLNATHKKTKSWLNSELPYLDHYIVKALLAGETRPRIVEIGDGILLNLRGANLNENADPEDMISLRLWIDDHRIISLQRRPLKAIKDIETKLLEAKGPENAGDFLCLLVQTLFERMEPILEDLDAATDQVEEDILDNATPEQREEVISIRKKAIMFRRYLAPQRDVINQFKNITSSWLSANNRRSLIEDHDRMIRYLEDLDAIRERSQIVKDELANILADRLNKNMYVLSVIAAIFLPLGFLTGLLGINVGGIPGAENSDAFIIFLGILVLIVAAQVVIFKKLKWF